MRYPKSEQCFSCGLSKTRHRMCVGRGSIPADVLFIGEGPGNSEDVTGIPFYGTSGKMLDTIINETRLRFSFYITNTVFCHPTDKLGGKNREPEEHEIFACMQNVVKIHDKVSPKVTIFVGDIAAQYYKKVFKPNRHILHPSFILRTGKKGSPFYFQTVRQLKEAVQCFVM